MLNGRIRQLSRNWALTCRTADEPPRLVFLALRGIVRESGGAFRGSNKKLGATPNFESEFLDDQDDAARDQFAG